MDAHRQGISPLMKSNSNSRAEKTSGSILNSNCYTLKNSMKIHGHSQGVGTLLLVVCIFVMMFNLLKLRFSLGLLIMINIISSWRH
jgi:hypothetical protein